MRRSLVRCTIAAAAAALTGGSIAAQEPSPPIVRGFNAANPGLADTAFWRDMRSWNANVVRLQVFPISESKRFHKSMWDGWPQVLDELETRVKLAIANNLDVVVDLHEAPMPDVNPTSHAMWTDPALAPNFVRMWSDIARRMLPYRAHIWGYDLYNEPIDHSLTAYLYNPPPDLAHEPRSPDQWRSVATTITTAIRTIDPTVWIIYEPGPSGHIDGFRNLQPLADHRVIYSAHFYYPEPFTGMGAGDGWRDVASGKIHDIHYGPGLQFQRKTLDSAAAFVVDFQQRYHVPIFIGEFSVVRWAPHDDAVRWIRDALDIFESHHWSWTWHIWRNYNGWSLEADDSGWIPGQPEPARVSTRTARGQVVYDALQRNPR